MPYPDQVERWRATVRRHTPADLRGDPGFERVALAVLMAESGGNPSAPGDRDKRTGQPHSIGLYQLHDEGMGSGLSVAQRSDPDVNAGRAVPALAAAYLRNRGDVTRTYIQAINPGALPDGPQVRDVLAAYGQGAGGPKVQMSVQPQTGGTVDEGQSAAELLARIERRKGKPRSVRPLDPTTKREPQTPAEKYDPNFQREQPNVSPVYRYLYDDNTYVDIKAVGEGQYEVIGGPAMKDAGAEEQADPVKQERDKIALERDRLALDEARRKAGAAASPEEQRLAQLEVRKAELAVQQAEANLKKTGEAAGPRASRTYRVGGVSYSEQADEGGGFRPLPGGVTDPDAMTPYQAASLPISQQNADSSRLQAQAQYLQAQVAKGNLDDKVALNIFQYIVAQKAPVEEGGKLYRPGREPSNVNRQFYGESVQPYSVVDAAGFFGRPDLNQHVRGPYPYGAGPMSAQEYSARQAQGALNASPPSSPAGGPVPSGAGPAAGGFQPEMQAQPQMPALTPTGPQFGATSSLMAQQQALLADTDRIRQFLLGQGYEPRRAEAFARRYVGMGRTMAQTPF